MNMVIITWVSTKTIPPTVATDVKQVPHIIHFGIFFALMMIFSKFGQDFVVSTSFMASNKNISVDYSKYNNHCPFHHQRFPNMGEV